VSSLSRAVANEVGRAGRQRGTLADAHSRKGIDHLALLVSKVSRETLRLPTNHVHRGGVKRRRHANTCALVGPLAQETQSCITDVAVRNTRDLHALNGDQGRGTVNGAERNHDLHRPLERRTAAPLQPIALFACQFHPRLHWFTSTHLPRANAKSASAQGGPDAIGGEGNLTQPNACRIEDGIRNRRSHRPLGTLTDAQVGLPGPVKQHGLDGRRLAKLQDRIGAPVRARDPVRSEGYLLLECPAR